MKVKKFNEEVDIFDDDEWDEKESEGNKTQKVSVYYQICGDYCAFHEMSFRVLYDITNNIQLDDYTLAELRTWNDRDYCDIQRVDAIKVKNKYYVDL